MRQFSPRPLWRWKPRRCSSLESTGPGGWPGSADDGGRSQLGGTAAERTGARRMGLDGRAVDLAEPRRGDRPAAAAFLLPVFPPPDLVARVFPAPGGRRDDLLDAEHRELVPLGLRGLPDRTASPGHLRGVPPRQGPVSVRRRVLEHHPGLARSRGPRRAWAGTGHQRQSRGGRGLAHPIDGGGPRPRLVAVSVARTLRPFRSQSETLTVTPPGFTPDRVS